MSHTLQLLLTMDVHVWMSVHTFLTEAMDILKYQLENTDQDNPLYDMLYEEHSRLQDATTKIMEAIDYYYAGPQTIDSSENDSLDDDFPEMLDSWTFIRS